MPSQRPSRSMFLYCVQRQNRWVICKGKGIYDIGLAAKQKIVMIWKMRTICSSRSLLHFLMLSDYSNTNTSDLLVTHRAKPVKKSGTCATPADENVVGQSAASLPHTLRARFIYLFNPSLSFVTMGVCTLFPLLCLLLFFSRAGK